MFGAVRPIEPDRDPRCEKAPDLLADKQARRDAERDGRESSRPAYGGNSDPCICKTEERHDEKGNPRMDGVFKDVERRRRIVRSAGRGSPWDRYSERDAGKGGVNA